MSKQEFIDALTCGRCQHDDCDNTTPSSEKIYCASCMDNPKKVRKAILKAFDRIDRSRKK